MCAAFAGAEPRWSSALVLWRVSDFAIDGFTGRQGPPAAGDTAVVLTPVKARSQRPGHRRLIDVHRDATCAIWIRDSRVLQGGAVVTYGSQQLRRAVKLS
jgi:hypothetical protein